MAATPTAQPRIKLRYRNLAIAVLSTFAVCGCGGGGSVQLTNGTGRAVIKVTWPVRSRLIPVAANSIRVVFMRGAQFVDSQLLPRPPQGVNQTTTTFNNLKTGNLTLTAT